MLKHVMLEKESNTEKLASDLASALRVPLIVFLKGCLGAGKTYFVRSVIHALGFEGAIKSPTYNLLETYRTKQYLINHFDLYRLSHAIEWYDLGFDEIVNTHSINFIEWSERIVEIALIPDIILSIKYEYGIRLAEIESCSNLGEELVEQWIKK